MESNDNELVLEITAAQAHAIYKSSTYQIQQLLLDVETQIRDAAPFGKSVKVVCIRGSTEHATYTVPAGTILKVSLVSNKILNVLHSKGFSARYEPGESYIAPGDDNEYVPHSLIIRW